jgi:hypothetical protein
MRVQAAQTAFIVRLGRGEHGEVIGIVERARTGEKMRLSGFDGIGRAVAAMVAAGEAARRGEEADVPSHPTSHTRQEA